MKLAIDLMKKMLAKDPNQRISADEALQHEWIVTGGTFLSPKSNNPVYLLLAQENMKKFQESYNQTFFHHLIPIDTALIINHKIMRKTYLRDQSMPLRL